MFSLQQLLEVLLCLLLHDGLTSTNVCRTNAGQHAFAGVTPWSLSLKPTQAEQPVLLLQSFQLLRHKRFHLLDVHPLTLLQGHHSVRAAH